MDRSASMAISIAAIASGSRLRSPRWLPPNYDRLILSVHIRQGAKGMQQRTTSRVHILRSIAVALSRCITNIPLYEPHERRPSMSCHARGSGQERPGIQFNERITSAASHSLASTQRVTSRDSAVIRLVRGSLSSRSSCLTICDAGGFIEISSDATGFLATFPRALERRRARGSMLGASRPTRGIQNRSAEKSPTMFADWRCWWTLTA